LLNLPQSQINLTLTGGLDTPPGEDRHIFKIYKTDLPSELQNANRLVFYWQLHESRTFVWANSLQENYDAPPTNDWGAMLTVTAFTTGAITRFRVGESMSAVWLKTYCLKPQP
jgi:hypothetical protein